MISCLGALIESSGGRTELWNDCQYDWPVHGSTSGRMRVIITSDGFMNWGLLSVYSKFESLLKFLKQLLFPFADNSMVVWKPRRHGILWQLWWVSANDANECLDRRAANGINHPRAKVKPHRLRIDILKIWETCVGSYCDSFAVLLHYDTGLHKTIFPFGNK